MTYNVFGGTLNLALSIYLLEQMQTEDITEDTQSHLTAQTGVSFRKTGTLVAK